MKMKLRHLALLFAAFLMSNNATAQPGYQFGQNKVQYKKFDWAILRTEHFDVHYYTEEAEAALDAARMAERGYAYLSETLDHKIKGRIPLVLYASLNDFQQTNVVSDLLDDGTRGVTEGQRKRVVLPITGTYREFNHVLVHELTHAFQFDIMSTRSNLNRFDPPLWFVEGMAEYLSVGMDNITRMWVRDGVLHDDLVSVQELNGTYDIRVYRLGESVWYYVGEKHGKKKVGEIFKTAVSYGDVERSFKEHLGLDFKGLTKAWHAFAKEDAMPADSSLQRIETVAQRLSKQAGYFHRMNLVPALSPDGKHVAYVANKNLTDEIYLLSMKDNGKYDERLLIKGGQSRDFESLRFFDTTINWSRDGQRLAFVSKSGKDDAIYVMAPFEDRITHRLVFNELNGLASPSFSPDGEQLVFTGIRGGRSDLYVVNLNDNKLTRLTEDRFAELQPQWSPDGESIAFVTDRGHGTNEEQLLFGDLDLALYSFATKEIEVLMDFEGNALNPQWSQDNNEIAFVSDHQGIPNIYRINLASRAVTPITALQSGVVGLTETTPAMSWSADGRTLVFTSFAKQRWHLYRMNLSDNVPLVTYNAAPSRFENTGSEVATIVVSDSAWLPATPEMNNFYTSYALTDEDSIEARKYNNKPSFSAASIGASFGGFFGTTGGAQFLFSDVLNHHNIILSTNLRRNLSNTDVGLAYLNQSRRINWGFETFQLNNAYGTFISSSAAGFVKQTYRGVNAFAYLPFSRYSRLEVSAGATFVDADFVVEQLNFQTGRIDKFSQDVGGAKFGQYGAALVYDNTVYGPLGPIAGRRSRLDVQRATNDFQFTTAVLDYRRYRNVLHRSVLALRVLGGGSFGRDAQVFQLGGPYTFRGSDYGELIGTRFLISNLEYRYPLLPFLPASEDFLSGVAFADAGAAWGIEVPGLVKEDFQPFSTEGGFHLQDLRGALGVGARLNLGYFVLKYDMAWPTDLRNFKSPVKQFSIGMDF